MPQSKIPKIDPNLVTKLLKDERLSEEVINKEKEFNENSEELTEKLMNSKEFHEKWRTSHTPWKRIARLERNGLCPCGSGKKWKKCTCEKYHDDQTKGWVV